MAKIKLSNDDSIEVLESYEDVKQMVNGCSSFIEVNLHTNHIKNKLKKCIQIRYIVSFTISECMD